jgi:hypothetical protein
MKIYQLTLHSGIEGVYSLETEAVEQAQAQLTAPTIPQYL